MAAKHSNDGHRFKELLYWGWYSGFWALCALVLLFAALHS